MSYIANAQASNIAANMATLIGSISKPVQENKSDQEVKPKTNIGRNMASVYGTYRPQDTPKYHMMYHWYYGGYRSDTYPILMSIMQDGKNDKGPAL